MEPVCIEVGQKRKRLDSGIGFQRLQRGTPGWPLRKGDGKLNKKRRKEQHTLGTPPQVFRSQKNYALQPTSLAAPTGSYKANQGPWAALASSNKGKEREHLTPQTLPPKPVPSPVRRLSTVPQGPRSNVPYSPPLPPTSPPKGPRSWLASQAQPPPLAPQTPPIAPRTPPTAPRAMQHHIPNNGYAGSSDIASPVPQPGYPQMQTQPVNNYANGNPTTIPPTQTAFLHMQQQQSQGVMYNAPFAGGPVTYHTGAGSSEPWQTQYNMATVAGPQHPPTCFIAYPDYSTGSYTYVPVPAIPSGYAPAPTAVDPYVAAATGQILSNGFVPPAVSVPTTGSSQPDGHQPISAISPDDDNDRSDRSTPEPSSHKKLPAEWMRKVKPILPIGHAPEADPHSKTGTYTKPLASQPNPACTLVLDSIPTRFRNPSWVQKWALNAGGAEPVCVDVDTKIGKALVEFVGAASARKAFQSKQLKGKGKHAIRAWWYRVTGVGSNAGVGEIEEGEVEDGSTKKSESIVQMSKSQKRKLRGKQQILQGPQGGSSGVQVTPSEDTTVDPKAHALSTERKEASVDAAAPREHQFSFGDFSVRFDGSSSAQDGVGVGHLVQDDNEDHLSIASSSGLLVTSHDDQAEDMDISTPLVTNHMSSDPLSASESCGNDDMTDVDPMPNVADMDVDSAVASASGDNDPVLSLDSEVAPPRQQDINSAVVPAMALTPPPTVPAPVCLDSYLNSTPTDLQSSLLCTEAPDKSSVEPSHSAELPPLAREKELEENSISTKSAPTMDEVAPTFPSSPLRLPVPLAREPSADKIALEMNLRRLVRESKQNKANTRSATASPASTHSTALPPASLAVAQPTPAVSPATFVLPVFF